MAAKRARLTSVPRVPTSGAVEGVRRVDILGCPFDAISFDDVMDAVRDAVVKGAPLQVVPCNVDSAMKARRDPAFAETLQKADLVIADGQFITWAAAWLGTPLEKRVSGTEIVWHCARISAETGKPVALIGAEEGVAPRAAQAMMERYPGSSVQALPTPFPLDGDANDRLVTAIRGSGAAIVLAALGAPRQERWVQANLGASGAPVGIGIGSAFDIICGDKPRAPVWMQKMSLEWFHRMLQEPHRLGRRYLIEDMPFVWHLAKEVARRRLHR